VPEIPDTAFLEWRAWPHPEDSPGVQTGWSKRERRCIVRRNEHAADERLRTIVNSREPWLMRH
jgi:hypothetical protein